MVLANNAVRLREIQANIIGDNAIFNTVMSIRYISQHGNMENHNKLSQFSCYYSSVHNTVSSANIRQTYNSVSSTGYNYSKKREKKDLKKKLKIQYR